MGVIFKIGKVWYVDYRYQGRRIRHRVGKSKFIADLALKDIEVQIARGQTGFLEKDYLLRTFLDEYLFYCRTNHAVSTFNRYRAVMDHLLRFLEEYPHISRLSHLGPKLFEDYKVWRRSTGSRTNTVNKELNVFRAMCNLAIKWNYLHQNPLKDVMTLKVTDAKAPRFLTREECEILLRECGPGLYPIFYTFLHTGMRLSELLNLTWDDLDFARHKIKIQKKPFWHPKTGEREIPINPQTEELLRGLNRNGVFVFNLQGQKIRFNYLRVQLMKVTKRCGFPDVTKIHSLRHTFASHLIMNGVDLPTIQKLLGHSEIETTMIYAHLTPDHLVEAVNKLDFGSKKPPA